MLDGLPFHPAPSHPPPPTIPLLHTSTPPPLPLTPRSPQACAGEAVGLSAAEVQQIAANRRLQVTWLMYHTTP